MYNQNDPQAAESEPAPIAPSTTSTNPAPTFIPGRDVAQRLERRPRMDLWALPLIIVTILGSLWYVYGILSCSALPASSQGECGWGWINFFMVLPIQLISFIIGLFMFTKGAGKVYDYLGYTKKKMNSMVLLWVFLIIIVIIVPLPFALNFALQALVVIVATVVLSRQLAKQRP